MVMLIDTGLIKLLCAFYNFRNGPVFLFVRRSSGVQHLTDLLRGNVTRSRESLSLRSLGAKKTRVRRASYCLLKSR